MSCGCHGERWYVALLTPGPIANFDPDDDDVSYLRPSLHRLGFQTFLPKRRERRGSRIVTVPAFTGSLFVSWREGAKWWRILSLPGVLPGGRGLVSPVGDPYGHPEQVPSEVMASLFSRCADGGVIEDASVEAILSPLAAGTAVRVLRGLLAGRNGLAGPLRGGKRHAVEVDGREVLIPRKDLEPL